MILVMTSVIVGELMIKDFWTEEEMDDLGTDDA